MTKSAACSETDVMAMNGPPILYLPIEEAKRELDARLLLAVLALEAGFRVVIGQQWLMIRNVGNFHRGVYFFKGMNNIQRNWMIVAKRCAHKICAIDEEVTAIADFDFILKEISESALNLTDRIFLQGPYQDYVYKTRFPHHEHRFSTTGNPRWDLLKENFRHFYTSEVQEIRQEVGDYILLNTNFGFANSYWGDPNRFVATAKQVGYVDVDDPFDCKWLIDQHEFENKNLQQFSALAARLARRHPDQRIVLRPHPAENTDFWHNRLPPESGVTIATDRSAIPWILASNVLIHNTCTTGIESFLLNHPTIAYCAFSNWVEEIFIANVVTPRVTDDAALDQMVDWALTDPDDMVTRQKARYREALSEHYGYLDKDLATNRILEEIKSLSIPAPPESLTRPGAELLTSVERNAYQQQKITLDDRQIGQRFREIARSIGRPAENRLETLGESLFCLHPDPK